MVKIKPPSQTRFGGFLLLVSFSENLSEKQQTMVKLQLAANAIAKSSSQVKPKPEHHKKFDT